MQVTPFNRTFVYRRSYSHSKKLKILLVFYSFIRNFVGIYGELVIHNG